MHNTIKHLAIFVSASALLSGCATVKMPNIDLPGLPEFKEAAQKLIEGFPEVSEAPARPEDIRSAKEWDDAASALMVERGGFVVPELGDTPATESEVSDEVARLKAQVRAYKLDDPQ